MASSPWVVADDAREHRLVEPEPLPERLLLGLADVARQQAVDRVAGQHPEQEEVEDRDGDQGDQRAAQLAEQERATQPAMSVCGG